MMLIFIINQWVLPADSSINVGLNPVSFLTSGTLGIPGVCLLYGITFYQILWDLTKSNFLKSGTGQTKKRLYIMRLTRQAITCCRTGWRGKTGVSSAEVTSGSFYLYSMLQVRSSNSSYDMWKSRGKEWSGSICNLRCSERICRKSDEHYFGKLKEEYQFHLFWNLQATWKKFSEKMPISRLLIAEEYPVEKRKEILAENRYLLTGKRSQEKSGKERMTGFRKKFRFTDIRVQRSFCRSNRQDGTERKKW